MSNKVGKNPEDFENKIGELNRIYGEIHDMVEILPLTDENQRKILAEEISQEINHLKSLSDHLQNIWEESNRPNHSETDS